MKDGKYKFIGLMWVLCFVMLEWFLDGRRLFTSTIVFRLNVDNGWKIWRYNGDLLFYEECVKIYEVMWCLVFDGMYEDCLIFFVFKCVES